MRSELLTRKRERMDEDRRGLTPRQLAKHFGVSIHRVRRLINEGCPRLAEGSCGPGHAARFDPQAVKQWLDARQYPGLAAQAAQDVLKIFKTVLCDALRTDDLKGRTLPAELMALKIYERAYRTIKQEPLQEKDLPPRVVAIPQHPFILR